jgi:hypothetical protein
VRSDASAGFALTLRTFVLDVAKPLQDFGSGRQIRDPQSSFDEIYFAPPIRDDHTNLGNNSRIDDVQGHL